MKAKLPKGLPPAEAITFSNEVSVSLSKAPREDVIIHELNAKLIESLQVVRELSGQKAAVPNRFDFRTADDNRDRPFISLRNNVKENSKHPDPQIAAASQAIYDIILEHGVDIHRKPYAAATHYYDALILDLSKPEMGAHLDSLKLTSLFHELVEKQNTFVEMRSRKVVSSTEVVDLESFNREIAKILVITENLINAFNAAASINKEYLPLVLEVNSIAESFITSLKARKTRKANEKRSEEESEKAEGDKVENDEAEQA